LGTGSESAGVSHRYDLVGTGGPSRHVLSTLPGAGTPTAPSWALSAIRDTRTRSHKKRLPHRYNLEQREYIVRSDGPECDVLTEKPMTTDAAQAAAIGTLDANIRDRSFSAARPGCHDLRQLRGRGSPLRRPPGGQSRAVKLRR
jgi:hypothetical protein